MLTPELKKFLDTYNEGLKLYRERKFSEALKYFEEALKLRENDGPSKLYIERCKMLIDNPPPENWDGVFTMTTK